MAIDGEIMEAMTDFIFFGSKIIADGDCSHEIKRCLLLGRKSMTNLDSILKSRDITLPTQFPSSKSYGFSRSHVLMLFNCGGGEDSLESLGLLGDQTSHS